MHIKTKMWSFLILHKIAHLYIYEQNSYEYNFLVPKLSNICFISLDTTIKNMLLYKHNKHVIVKWLR